MLPAIFLASNGHLATYRGEHCQVAGAIRQPKDDR
jgi:hypothetical protein